MMLLAAAKSPTSMSFFPVPHFLTPTSIATHAPCHNLLLLLVPSQAALLIPPHRSARPDTPTATSYQTIFRAKADPFPPHIAPFL